MTDISDRMEHLAGLEKNVKDARAEFMAGLRTIREHIAQWKSQRDAALALPVTLDFAQERVEQWVDERIAHAIRNLFGNYEKPPSPESFVVSPKNWNSPEANILTLMAYYLRDDLVAAIKKEVTAFYSSTELNTISEADRVDRVSMLDSDILDAEKSEESIVRFAKNSGFRADRRKDTDPAVILLSDDDLP